MLSICVYLYIYIYIYIYRERERERDVCVCVCIYIYIHIHTCYYYYYHYYRWLSWRTAQWAKSFVPSHRFICTFYFIGSLLSHVCLLHVCYMFFVFAGLRPTLGRPPKPSTVNFLGVLCFMFS